MTPTQNSSKTSKQQAQHKSTRSCRDDCVCCCCRHRTHSSRGTSNSGRKMEVIDVVVAFAVAAVIVHASNSIERRMRVRGGDNVAEAQKGGDARVGMKKQPVLETKNREAGGSSPEKRRRSVAKRRSAQTGTDRDSVRKFWSRDFWTLRLHRNSGRFRPRCATSKILCITRIGVLNQFVRVLIDDDPLEKLSS